MRNNINKFLDFFYPIFKRFMPIETYRYATCGGINTLSGLLVWYICYHIVFSRMVVNLVYFSFEPYTLALFVSSTYSFSLGFLLNKYVVFTSSNLKGRIQLFRYFLSFAFNLLLNYFLLKLLVEKFVLDAFLSQLLTTIVVIAVSYFSQKHFTFKIK